MEWCSRRKAFLLNVWGPAAAADLTNNGKMGLVVGNVVLLNKAGSVPPTPAPTTTALTALPNPAVAGTTVTLTATVTSTTAGIYHRYGYFLRWRNFDWDRQCGRGRRGHAANIDAKCCDSLAHGEVQR